MKAAGIGFCLLFLATAAAPCPGADVGIVTILGGPGRLLRGPTWFTLVEGGRVQDGDLIDLRPASQAQIEFVSGVLLNLSGPASLYLASMAPRAGEKAASAELFVSAGWLKVAAREPRNGLRLRTALGTIELADAILVLHAEASGEAVFVESGTALLIEPQRGGAPTASRQAKGGEYWSRVAGNPFAAVPRPPQAFLEGMPRQFMDPLPSRATKLKETRRALPVDRDVQYAEAKPSLFGPYRKAFLQSLRPRLADPAFRNAVEVDIRALPEWDRLLHPEKYLPKKDGERR